MHVVLGCRVDCIGKNAVNRDVKAVRGPVELVLGASPGPKAGQLVGDPEKIVYGELYATECYKRRHTTKCLNYRSYVANRVESYIRPIVNSYSSWFKYKSPYRVIPTSTIVGRGY
jgi:hypothetical protein